MADSTELRNSRILSLFDEILHGPPGTLRAVEIAGRGIAAEACCTLAVLDGKAQRYSDPPERALQRSIESADLLVNLGEIEDDLAEAWRRRRADDFDDAAFEEALRNIVLRLEEWPAQWSA